MGRTKILNNKKNITLTTVLIEQSQLEKSYNSNNDAFLNQYTLDETANRKMIYDHVDTANTITIANITH